jgi:hypothetical protein
MGSLEAMTKGSDARYLGDILKLKVAQGVVGAVADKGSVLRFIPYTMQAVKQGFQDLGASSLQSAHDLLRSETLRLEVCSCCTIVFFQHVLDFNTNHLRLENFIFFINKEIVKQLKLIFATIMCILELAPNLIDFLMVIKPYEL